MPLGILALVVAAFAVSFVPGGRAQWRTEAMLLISAVAIVAFATCSRAPQCFRYVLPVMPFVCIWAGKAALLPQHKGREGHEACAMSATSVRIQGMGGLVVAGCIAWSVGSSLWVYPHSISYFNELAGGPLGGHRYLIDSSIDWGQDLLYLKKWLDRRPDALPLHLAYWGIMDPRSAGIEFSLLPPTLLDEQLEEQGAGPRWYAVSVNFLRGYDDDGWWVYDGRGGKKHVSRGDYVRFLRWQPVATAAYSIYIYHVAGDEIEGR